MQGQSRTKTRDDFNNELVNLDEGNKPPVLERVGPDVRRRKTRHDISEIYAGPDDICLIVLFIPKYLRVSWFCREWRFHIQKSLAQSNHWRPPEYALLDIHMYIQVADLSTSPVNLVAIR